MDQDIAGPIRAYILEEFLPGEQPENLTDDLPLISSGILDSIATLKLVLFIEERFDVVLEAHEADKENMDSIRQIVEIVSSKRA